MLRCRQISSRVNSHGGFYDSGGPRLIRALVGRMSSDKNTGARDKEMKRHGTASNKVGRDEKQTEAL